MVRVRFVNSFFTVGSSWRIPTIECQIRALPLKDARNLGEFQARPHKLSVQPNLSDLQVRGFLDLEAIVALEDDENEYEDELGRSYVQDRARRYDVFYRLHRG